MNILKPTTYFLSFIAIVAVLFAASLSLQASETNGTIIVDGPDAGFAWSDQAGWVNFGATNGNIHITDSGITGHAWNENHGWINMAPSLGGVLIDPHGALSGHAWGEGLGWINFSGVSINASGTFVGQATGALIGTLTFDCTNCDVRTEYVPQNFRSPDEEDGESSNGGSGSRGGGSGIQLGCKDPNATNYNFFSTHTQELCEYGESSVGNPGTSPSQSLARSPSPSLSQISDLTGSGTEDAERGIPEQLFDIRLLLDRDTLPRTADLVARVTFDSFGRVPTPVEMTFSIIGENGSELWKGSDTTSVETSAVFVKRFTDVPELPPGPYMLRLQTLYNTDVHDTFEAPFTIADSAADSYWLRWLIGAVLAVIAFFFFLLWRRRKEKKEEERKHRRF